MMCEETPADSVEQPVAGKPTPIRTTRLSSVGWAQPGLAFADPFTGRTPATAVETYCRLHGNGEAILQVYGFLTPGKPIDGFVSLTMSLPTFSDPKAAAAYEKVVGGALSAARVGLSTLRSALTQSRQVNYDSTLAMTISRTCLERLTPAFQRLTDETVQSLRQGGTPDITWGARWKKTLMATLFGLFDEVVMVNPYHPKLVRPDAAKVSIVMGLQRRQLEALMLGFGKSGEEFFKMLDLKVAVRNGKGTEPSDAEVVSAEV